MCNKISLEPPLYFSYSQFMVYDQAVQAPGCRWTERHTRQGFARRESAVCFSTLLEFGRADVTCSLCRFQSAEDYERVIAVPFLTTTGKVLVEGPEELNVTRVIELEKGNYRLVAAQRVTGDKTERLDLFFEKLEGPSRKSDILVADPELRPEVPLLDTADVA